VGGRRGRTRAPPSHTSVESQFVSKDTVSSTRPLAASSRRSLRNGASSGRKATVEKKPDACRWIRWGLPVAAAVAQASVTIARTRPRLPTARFPVAPTYEVLVSVRPQETIIDRQTKQLYLSYERTFAFAREDQTHPSANSVCGCFHTIDHSCCSNSFS
jgi:hypothetical protein